MAGYWYTRLVSGGFNLRGGYREEAGAEDCLSGGYCLPSRMDYGGEDA